ncbi:hypothetical protein [Conyzicola nivalis]
MRRVHAVLLSLVIALSAASIAEPTLTLWAGVAALLSLAVGLLLVRGAPRLIAVALTVSGLAALAVGAADGRRPSLTDLLSVNQDLVGMLAAVSFLRLLSLGGETPRGRSSGVAAVTRTALVVHGLGSVINISAVAMAGDRLARAAPLRMADAMLLTRAYAAGAFWSPFWVAAAAAVSYAPGADAAVTIGLGLAVAVVVLLISMVDVYRAFGDDRSRYQGYPLTWAILRIPLALVVFVLAVHLSMPAVPIPRVVLIGSLVVALAGVLVSFGRRGFALLATHATAGLSGLRSETTLFVAAGVLTVGLQTLVPMIDVLLPVDGYGVWVAWASVIVMVVLAVVGIHPIVSLALVAVVVMPLEPDPTLFVLAATIGWGTAAAVGPTSGILMHVSARFGLDGLTLAWRNAPFFVITVAVALPALFLASVITD